MSSCPCGLSSVFSCFLSSVHLRSFFLYILTCILTTLLQESLLLFLSPYFRKFISLFLFYFRCFHSPFILPLFHPSSHPAVRLYFSFHYSCFACCFAFSNVPSMNPAVLLCSLLICSFTSFLHTQHSLHIGMYEATHVVMEVVSS